MATTTLTFGRVYKSSTIYEHSNQVLHIPEIDDTTSATFLSKYGLSANDIVSGLSVQLPLRIAPEDGGKTFNNLRVVIFNGFTGKINNSSNSSADTWFSYSSSAPDTDNMVVKWNNTNVRQNGFCKTAIDGGKLIGTPLAYFDASFTAPAAPSDGGAIEINLTLNSTNSTVTITDAGRNVNNWAPKGYEVASGYGLFIGFYNTAVDFWSDVDNHQGLNWGTYNSTKCTPYVYVNLTTGGLVRYYDGSAWKNCEVYYHTGSEWKRCEVQYHDGTTWKPIG